MSKKILFFLTTIVIVRVLIFVALNARNWKIFLMISAISLGVFLIYKMFKRTLVLYPAVVILVLSGSHLYQPLELRFDSNPVPVWITDEQRREHGINYDSFWVLAMHNKVVNYTYFYLEHYFNYFQDDFLFTNGTFLYLFDALFVGLGFWVIIRSPKGWATILIWLFAAPLISAADFQPPTALKAVNMIVPLSIISSVGALTLFNIIYKQLKGVQ